METKILLLDNSKNSTIARNLLIQAEVPFCELAADKFWKEIEFPIPSFFVTSNQGSIIFKGLEEIQDAPEVLGYGKPN